MAGRRVLAAVAAAGVLGAGATAALGADGGRTLPPPRQPVQPLRGSVRVESIRATDPDGGAPWGIRTFTSPAGRACQQEGRIVGGKLGTIDDHGAFTEMPYYDSDCSSSNDPAPATYGFFLTHTDVAPGPTCVPIGARVALSPLPGCPASTQRTVFDGLFGSDLTRVVFADASGRHAHRLPIGPRGDFIAVIRGGISDITTTPRIALTFDSGCTRAGRARLGMFGARRHGCTVVVPDLFGPRPVPESAASKRARRNPSAPVHVSAEAQPNVHPRVFFLAKFRVPITAGLGEGYAFRVRGPGSFPSCADSLDETESSPELSYATMVHGRVASLLVQPLNPSDHRRFCPGRFRVDVFFVSHGHAFAPFGHAFMDVRAVR